MNPTQKSLLEQMEIHEFEIERRKELLEFGSSDVKLLHNCFDLIHREVHSVVGIFYEKQTAINEISLIIGDLDTLARLRSAMTRYITDLFSGDYGAEYVNNRLRIGLVHKRIGVEPKYYLSAMRILKSLLFDVLSKELRGNPDLAPTLQALDKLLYFDNEFVFDTYIRSLLSEIEAAKDKAVHHALSLEQKVQERTQELEEYSRRDPLTGLYNQRHFVESLRRELSRARRANASVALLYMDIDNFKQINDSQGHLAGDEVLRSLGMAIQQLARSYDIACRYGGDEFCIVLPDTTAEGACDFAERLQDAMRLAGVATISIGIAVSEGLNAFNATELMSAADQRMYAAKSWGGGQNCSKDEDRAVKLISSDAA